MSSRICAAERLSVPIVPLVELTLRSYSKQYERVMVRSSRIIIIHRAEIAILIAFVANLGMW